MKPSVSIAPPIMTLVLAFFITTCPAPGQAHRLNVFCWVNGDTATCEGSFSSGRAVHNATMDVIAVQTGKHLITGQTDDKGAFSFSIPESARTKAWDLKVMCTSTMGHASSWTIRAKDHTPVESTGAAAPESPPEKLESATAVRQEPTHPIPLSQQELKEVIAAVVSSQLEPVHKELARLRSPRTSFQDIVGGTGYIFGIMGIIMFFKSRGS